jgi:acyl carrier protein
MFPKSARKAHWKSWELDSLDTVDLIMQFEDEFQVSLELNDNIKTVADIVKLIQESMGKK